MGLAQRRHALFTIPAGPATARWGLLAANHEYTDEARQPGMPNGRPGDPANPTKYSNWPDGAAAGRPRSAVVMITKQDGGLIGT
jgi:secreted PhoX family phosphatase